MGFIYKSYKDLVQDIRDWADHVPEVSAVCGVTRSGIAPAAILAQHRNIPLVPIETLLGGCNAFRTHCSRDMNKPSGPVLVLDDTCWQGRTVALLREKIKGDVLFGSVYRSAKAEGIVDLAGYVLPHGCHSFEWNLLHDIHAKRSAVDMDGVLCQDWGRPDHGHWLPAYEQFLVEARPLLVPSRPLAAIVTARLEKYRPQTEAWLARHGVVYHNLIMAPFESTHERARAGVSRWKSAVYLDLVQHNGVLVYVESDTRQAQEIASLSKAPVIGFEAGKIWNGDQANALFEAKPFKGMREPNA